jgi:hypothetical protein
MTSEKQAKANRKNALKSTGPKTPEGKDAVRLNALKHGLLSQETLLPGEDEEALRTLGERLRDELQPAGELENLLVERIITSYWRLRRLGRVEAGIFARELYGELAKRAYVEAIRFTKEASVLDDELDYFRPTTTITDDERYQEAISKAREMDAKREAETATRTARTLSPSSRATRLRSNVASTELCTNSSACKRHAVVVAAPHRLRP